MTVVYDNWERLVTAVLRREELWLSGLRTPSDVFSLSSASASPSFNFSSNPRQVSSLSSWSLLVGESFTYHQILKATDFLSDSNLIKHGHSGKLFYGVLEGGTQVVVKKVDLSCVENELCLMSELEICGMLYHSRLVPLLGHCLENGHEKFLVYRYTPNKDLASFMRYDKIKQLPSLDWTVRLKIATGVAEGLCYLHDKCFPPLVHRDIQASSILLDDDFEVRLGSLTAVCIEEQVYNQSRIARFLRLPKGSKQTTGTSTTSCSYDVYCFGNVLLELVTGNLGVSAANGSSMKDWMENALSYVVSNDKKLILNIVDNSLIIDEHLLMEVWALAFVAKACVQHKPSKRPQMPEILEAVKHIKLTRVSNGHLQPASYPSKLFPPPTMTALPEGSRTIDRIQGSRCRRKPGVLISEQKRRLSQAIQNARSSGNSTASWNYVFMRTKRFIHAVESWLTVF
nr:probable LRR receptor-like serine/threonine-protein kinase At2g16250 isoform X1 [Coffea arabica]